MRPRLDESISLYLDLARIAAALLVLLHHVFQPPYFSQVVHIPGRSAVIVFFVISGFVIAYASDGLQDWRSYAVARLTRVYSVAVPALLLTAALVWLAAHLWPANPGNSFDHPALRLGASLLFINHLWNLTIGTLSNGPYWSLCYEVWYYLLFGVAKFGHGRWRWLVIAAILLAVGPRILLLMPIWGLGVWLYGAMKARPKSLSTPSRLPFWLSTAAFLFALFVHNPADAVAALVEQSLRDGYWHIGALRMFIGGDWRFPSDYLLSALFAASVWHGTKAFSPGAASRWLGRSIRSASSYTFSLYLFHAPLLVFLYQWLRNGTPPPPPQWMPWALLLLILLCVWLLGRFTEHRKRPYTLLFSKLLGLPPRASQ